MGRSAQWALLLKGISETQDDTSRDKAECSINVVQIQKLKRERLKPRGDRDGTDGVLNGAFAHTADGLLLTA